MAHIRIFTLICRLVRMVLARTEWCEDVLQPQQRYQEKRRSTLGE